MRTGTIHEAVTVPEHRTPVTAAHTHPSTLLYLDLQLYRDILLLRFRESPWNAFTLRQWEELDAVLAALQGDNSEGRGEILPRSRSSLRGVVLVGSKTMFSVGDDSSQWTVSSDAHKRAWETAAETCCARLAALVKELPVAAALSGYTCGRAWELAQQCSYRVMGDNARLYPSPEQGFINPSDALAAGMVERLAAPDLVLHEAQEWLFDDLHDSDHDDGR